MFGGHLSLVMRRSSRIHDSASAADSNSATRVVSPGRLTSTVNPEPAGMIRYVGSVMLNGPFAISGC